MLRRSLVDNCIVNKLSELLDNEIVNCIEQRQVDVKSFVKWKMWHHQYEKVYKLKHPIIKWGIQRSDKLLSNYCIDYPDMLESTHLL